MKIFNKNISIFLVQNEQKIRKSIIEAESFIDGYYSVLLRSEIAHNKIPKLSEKKNGKYTEIPESLQESLHREIESIKQSCLMNSLSFNPIIK